MLPGALDRRALLDVQLDNLRAPHTPKSVALKYLNFGGEVRHLARCSKTATVRRLYGPSARLTGGQSHIIVFDGGRILVKYRRGGLQIVSVESEVHSWLSLDSTVSAFCYESFWYC
jgi:hypothetical protein